MTTEHASRPPFALATVAALRMVLLSGCVAVEIPVSGPAPEPAAPRPLVHPEDDGPTCG